MTSLVLHSVNGEVLRVYNFMKHKVSFSPKLNIEVKIPLSRTKIYVKAISCNLIMHPPPNTQNEPVSMLSKAI